MKISKIATTFAALNLVLFMSVSSLARPFTNYEGGTIKTGVKKQIEADKMTNAEIASSSTSSDDFSHLRFDVNIFSTGSTVEELPITTLDYLRFDVNNFDNGLDLSEMPVNEFEYLRFDVNKYSNENASEIVELPAML